MSINISPGWYNAGQRPLHTPHTHAQRNQTPQGTPVEQTPATAESGVVRLGPRQSAQDTAANILAQVQSGLDSLASSGASAERLQQRLEAARAGIEKGYSEATAMLKDMGMLDDELEADIGESRSLVDQGLEALNQNISNPQVKTLQSSAVAQSENTLSLQVLTRDGDRVQVSFYQNAGSSVQSGAGNMRFTSEYQQGFDMQVSGSLSDDEKAALTSLFSDVQSLSEQFFAGDLGAALESAMSLGFDGSQLASLSLNLTQKSMVATSRSYAPYQAPYPLQLPTPELESLKAPLALYAEQYVNALEKAGALNEPQNLFRDLVQQMMPQGDRMNAWQSFHQGLNQASGLFG